MLIAPTPENILRWSNFTTSIRKTLSKQGFIEVSTPCIVTEGAFESSIDPLQVRWSKGQAELHTSPEIHMKKVLTKVSAPIFQICHCFRDDFEGPHHSREFTMLELYQKDKTYQDTMRLVQMLVTELSIKKLNFQFVSIQEIFLRETGLSLVDLTDVRAFRSEIAHRSTVETAEGDSWEDLFFRILLERIEPKLPSDTPTFLYDYPLAVSPLSKAKGAFAERFELYWKGMELCNGCTELSDPMELKQRHEAEAAKRKALGKEPHRFSQKLSEATAEIGNCAGVAVGLERLFLALHGVP